MGSKSNRRFKIVLGLSILAAGAVFASVAIKLKPEAKKTVRENQAPVVEVLTVKRQNVPLVLPSQGLVTARKTTSLAAEVSGKIVNVSPKFKAGGEFEEGEVLFEIDSADYEAALADTKSAQAEAELTLKTEEARVDQAKRDWEALGRSEAPTDLVLRKPQLASARARVEAAAAAVQRAERNLERTKVKAPYDARVRAIETDLGSYIAAGTPVATIYTRAPYEIRLPLSLDEYAFVKKGESGEPEANVRLKAEAAGDVFEWKAGVIRTEGEVERASRSIYLVAEIGEGAGTKESEALMQPGLFFQADVEGRTLEGVYRIPMTAFRDLERVVVVGDESKLRFRDVKVVRRQAGEALVVEGLQDGDRVCLTEVEDVIEGMEVKVADGDTKPLASQGDGPEGRSVSFDPKP